MTAAFLAVGKSIAPTNHYKRIETYLSDYIISAAKVHKLKSSSLWGILLFAIPFGTTAGTFLGLMSGALVTKVIPGPQYYALGMSVLGAGVGLYRGFSWGYNLAGRTFELIELGTA